MMKTACVLRTDIDTNKPLLFNTLGYQGPQTMDDTLKEHS